MADPAPQSSLTLEPNPFEQSFASNAHQGVNDKPGAVDDTNDSARLAHGEPLKHGPIPDQKQSVNGIDKQVTPLPFASTTVLNAGMFPMGANPLGLTPHNGRWMPPRLGTLTPSIPGAQTFDSFVTGQPTAGGNSSNGKPPDSPQIPVLPRPVAGGMAIRPGGAISPYLEPYGPGIRGALPLESPGIIMGAPYTAPGVGIPANPAQPQHHAVTAPPQGENAAANGLYLLSQNPATSGEANAVSVQVPVAGGGPDAHSQQQHQQTSSRSDTRLQSKSQASGPHKKGDDGDHPRMTDHDARKRSRRASKDDNDDGIAVTESETDRAVKRKLDSSAGSENEDSEERRKQFLERNRLAAIKCRQRKKQWVDGLKHQVDVLNRVNEDVSRKNEKLQRDIDQLRQFILGFHDPRMLPQHVLAIVDYSPQGEGGGPSTVAASSATQGYHTSHRQGSALDGRYFVPQSSATTSMASEPGHVTNSPAAPNAASDLQGSSHPRPPVQHHIHHQIQQMTQ